MVIETRDYFHSLNENGIWELWIEPMTDTLS